LKDKYLGDAFGVSRIIGGVGYVATTIDRPGVIRQTGPMQRLLFGELDGTTSERGGRFLEACLKGGIGAESSPDVRREIWQKFVFLVGLSGATTTIPQPIGPIRENEQTRAFLLDVMREVVAVARVAAASMAARTAGCGAQLLRRYHDHQTIWTTVMTILVRGWQRRRTGPKWPALSPLSRLWRNRPVARL
jgi:ketopantoate reductase